MPSVLVSRFDTPQRLANPTQVLRGKHPSSGSRTNLINHRRARILVPSLTRRRARALWNINDVLRPTDQIHRQARR